MSGTKRSYSWTKKKVHDLITLYKKHECLWNCSIESYKDREKRLEAINEICGLIGITKEQFARKIHNLRNQFNFEIKKVEKKKSAADGSEEYITKWEYFDRLKFLRKFITARPTFDSFKYDFQNVTTKEEITNNLENNAEIIIEEQNITPENLESQDHLNEVVHEEVYEASADVATYPSGLAMKDGGNQTAANYQPTFIPMPKKHRTDFESSVEECEIFGQFVTSELRSLRSEVSRKKLKRRIMQAILEVGNEDDGININIKLT